MNLSLRMKIEEVCMSWGIKEEIILRYIEEDWIRPADYEHRLLDEEDMARIKLIFELTEEWGVNDEAVPIILNLVDQLNLLHRKLRTL
jgi:chaperone modulatory protein CbpM